MTRPSMRTNILDAALRVAERDGVTGITLDAVAQEAGLTKAGLMYYFPSREALLCCIQEHLFVFWEGAMEAAAGKTAAVATPEERLGAYARVAAPWPASADLGRCTASCRTTRMAWASARPSSGATPARCPGARRS